jgi:ABC-type transport system substrate-binding protein
LTEGQRLVAERNPYYWKTDPDGRQLPYIDSVDVEVIADPEVAVLRTGRGEFSLVPDEFMVVRNKPVLAEDRRQGGYHFIDMPQSNMNNATFVFNLTHKDPKLREVFQNKDFRIGLSYAIDRQEIIDGLLQRQGEPWQTSPLRNSIYYNEKFAKQYTEYSVDKANEHLDRAGYTNRDTEGFRLRPDGERISFNLQVRLGTISTWVDTAELVSGYWRKVGVDARIKTGSSELVFARVFANDHDCVMDDGYPGLDDTLLDPIWYFPEHAECQWAITWGQWYASGGAEGEKPPPPVRKQMALFDQIKTTPVKERQQELFKQLLQIAQEEFYVIGTALPLGGYSVIQNDFHNVPDKLLWATVIPSPGWTNPEQYYIK